MPEQVIQTILAALDNYEGDTEEIALAKKWVEALHEEPVELAPQELAELKQAIAESEDEEASGFYYTLEEVEERIKTKIANYKSRNSKATA